MTLAFKGIALAVALSWSAAQAAVFNVNAVVDVVDAVPGDGICATAAGLCTLRAAVQESNALFGPDVINVPAGNYLFAIGGNDNNAARGDLDINDNVVIAGAGEFATVIDANFIDRVFEIRNSTSLTLTDLTVQNGLVGGAGGGIDVDRGNIFATRVTLNNNVSNNSGGGVFLNRSGFVAQFTDVTFSANTAKGGGGIFSNNNNIAITILRTGFLNNAAGNDGGAIYIKKGGLTVSQSLFSGNTARDGGAIFIEDKNVITTVDETRFTANTATEDGGALYLEEGLTSVTASLFDANVGRDGAAIYTDKNEVQLDLLNVTVSGNSATSDGGGLYSKKGTTTMSHVSLANNTANTGAGIRRQGGQVTLVNTLLSNNITGNCSGTIVSSDNNLDSGTSCGFSQPADLNSTDPLLGPLQDNGGFTFTHALLDFSPARDAAQLGVCPGTDQRGEPRPLDGDGDSVDDCDIGAYEAPIPLPDYALAKSVATESDPYSVSNPKAIPGAVLVYTLTGSNAGPGAAQSDTLFLEDQIPPGTALMVTDFDGLNPGPVAFMDGVPASGLTYTFTSLASTTDSIEFSSDGAATFTYTPVANANGADPLVTHFRIVPTGTALFTGADPVFQFLFKVEVQ